VLTELQQRGVEDILIACVDGLKGFPDAINAVFLHTPEQSGHRFRHYPDTLSVLIRTPIPG